MSGKSPKRAAPKKRAIAKKRATTKKRTEPDSFRGRALSASLTANDIHKSLAWYSDVLGFTVVEKYEREGKLQFVSLKAGAVELGLGQDDGAKGLNRIKGEGFSFRITTAQKVDDIAKRIKTAGGTLESDPIDAYGARAFTVRDPDGFKIVISSER